MSTILLKWQNTYYRLVYENCRCRNRLCRLVNAVLLSQNHEVIALDINSARVTQLNNKISPILDDEIQDFLENKQLNFLATSSKKQVYENADYVITFTINQGVAKFIEWYKNYYNV